MAYTLIVNYYGQHINQRVTGGTPENMRLVWIIENIQWCKCRVSIGIQPLTFTGTLHSEIALLSAMRKQAIPNCIRTHVPRFLIGGPRPEEVSLAREQPSYASMHLICTYSSNAREMISGGRSVGTPSVRPKAEWSKLLQHHCEKQMNSRE